MSEKVEKIKGDIKKIEASIKVYSKKNDATSKKIIQSFKSKLDVFEKELQKAEKEEQSALKKIKIRATSKKVADLKKLISSKKYAIYKNSDVDLEKDAARPALPIGKRKSKITGNTYYEYRANRIDVKQPAKRYPKLEHGGYMAKGGTLSSIKEKYEENEDNNAHSENVVLLAKHFGTKEDLAEAKKILALHNKEGHLTTDNSQKRRELHLKLIETARKEMSKEGIKFAKGGEVENLEKELRKLQRELNSGRLSTYKQGDKSEEEMNRQKERAEKMARFYEVLKLLREKDNKMAKGGGIDGQKIAKPSGWRWKNSAVTDGIISESSLYKTPSERMRKMYPDYVDFENRTTKSDKNPSKKFISLETGGQMAKGGGFNQYGEPYGFEEDNSDSVYEIHHKPEMNEKNPFLIWDKIDGVYIAEFPNRQRAIHYIDNKFETGGQMAHGADVEKRVNTLYSTYGFINDDYNWRLKLLEMLQNPSYEAYEIYQSLNEEQKGQVLQELYEMDNDMGSYGDGDIETSKENLEIILDDSKNAKPKFEHGGYMAHGGEMEDDFMIWDENGKKYELFKKEGDIYYFDSYGTNFGSALTISEEDLKNKIRQGKYNFSKSYMAYGGMLNHGFNVGDKILDIYKGQGIVENNNNGVIEVINPSKGTRFIIGLDDSKRSGRRESVEMTIDEAIKQAKKYIDYTSEGDKEVLDNFVDIIKKYGQTYAKGGGIEDIDMNKVESSALFYTDESKWTPKPTIKKFADEIAEMEKLKKMLDNKEITPSKIIGTGYKSQYVRPLAYRWLNEQILIAKRAIEILQERGHTYANGGELHRLQQ
jgi:hypothetical protein